MIKLKHWFSICLILPFLWSCSEEDNINDIFVSGTWNVGNFYQGGNWNKVNDGARPLYTENEDLKALNAMTVNFMNDGTLQGKAGNVTFTANWNANGKDRTVSITQWKITNNPAGMAQKLIEALQNAAYYKGDSKYLKLAPEDKKTYIQFAHY